MSTSAADVEFTIETGDVRTFPADVLALKYAQGFHGADRAVAAELERGGIQLDDLRPSVGSHRFVDTRGSVAPRWALFLGMPSLGGIAYGDLRTFASRAVGAVAQEKPDTRSLAMTIHGPGFGLDEIESFYNQFSGSIEGLAENSSLGLRRLSVVERDQARVKRLGAALKHYAVDSGLQVESLLEEDTRWIFKFGAPGSPRGATHLDTQVQALPGFRSEEKPVAFVAMPFAEDREDVFYLGIQPAARDAGYLCERVDQEAFVGPIMDRVTAGIDRAAFVIADLAGANPNVFLEVGYAWGKARPTIFLSLKGQEPPFDVRGHNRLVYESGRIWKLQDELTKLLRALRADLRH
jgi:hypothetical protein